MVISEELGKDIKNATTELKYHNMPCYDIYPWSNEHLENYYNYYDLKDKKVLCITGSGDHAIHAIAGGAIEIDCVDINTLAKYYQALKLAFISKYNKDKFKKQFKNNNKQVLNPNIKLKNIREFLDDDTYLFWNNLIDLDTFKNNRNLFRFDGEPYPIAINYEQIKMNINNVIITCYDDDIKYFIQDIDKKYDVIFLSNVLEWHNFPVRQAIIENCFNILEPNGVIYDAICRRDFDAAEEFDNLEKKIPTKFYDDSTLVEKGVYVYRKK